MRMREDIKNWDSRFRRRSLWLTYALLLSCFLFLISMICWMYFGMIEESVSASGEVVTVQREKRIMAPSSGIVSRLYVKENQAVQQGDLILEFNQALVSVEAKALEAKRKQLADEIATLQAAYSGSNPQLSSSNYGSLQNAWLVSTKATRDAEIRSVRLDKDQAKDKVKEYMRRKEKIERLLDNSETVFSQSKLLFEIGGLSRHELWDLEQEVVLRRGELAETLEQLSAAKAALTQASEQETLVKNRYKSALLSRLTDLQEQESELEKELSKNQLNQTLHQVRAPFDGIIHRLGIHGEQEVYATGDLLLSIIPNSGGLLAELRLANKDFGYVSPGQEVSFRIDAYPLQRFGKISGKVLEISPSTVLGPDDKPYYILKASFAENAFKKDGRDYPLKPGMTLTGDLITHSKNILSFFTDPVFSSLDETFRLPSSR